MPYLIEECLEFSPHCINQNIVSDVMSQLRDKGSITKQELQDILDNSKQGNGNLFQIDLCT